ncbi:ROK family transcriptional regulator [Fodinicola feengrottensis]|uniref:ROK family transcriptional regulator n=1 Tax=Fodinicola feengrottensis TaxID=435914 RepID=UPI0013D0E054|nr:ROK family transcriptional regulator [Fodinicola feengrottensis]
MIGPRSVVPAGDLTRLRQINERAVLAAIRVGGELRLAELVSLTGLTRASLTEVIRGLRDKGWVVEQDAMTAGRGRPAHRYRFHAEAGHVVGLDIGAYAVKAAVGDLAGTVLGEARRQTRPADSRAKRLDSTVDAVGDCLRAAELPANAVWMTTAGTTGRIDRNGRILLSAAIPGAGLDLAGRLAELLGGPVLVENDVRLTTLAEQRLGMARGVRDLVVLQAGRRVGLGLVLDGAVRHGHRGAAADVSSFSALSCDHAVDFLDLCPAVPATGGTGDRIQDVLTAAAEGQPAAVNAVGRYVRAVSQVAAAAVSLIDPEMLLITGTLAPYADLVRPILLDESHLRCITVPRVEVSTLGPDAVHQGAVQYALDHLADLLLGDPDSALPALTRPQ